MPVQVTLRVSRDGRYWVGVPDGYPGSCMGRSITELMREAQAIMPFMVCGCNGVPAQDVVIDYVVTDVPAELSSDNPQRDRAAQRNARQAAE